MSKDSTCYAKATAKGEATFTLRGQDKSSAKLVVLWIAENIETASDHKLREALEDALALRACPYRRAAD